MDDMLAAILAALALSPGALLARHQPVVVLHPDERFRPVAVEGFLADAALEARSADGAWTEVASPSLPTSSCANAPCWRLNHRTCAASIGVASVACYAASESARAAPSVVYGAVLRRRDRIALQYWYWYSYDFWDGLHPPTDYVWQAHEGDWEVVTVILTRAGKPLVAGYSSHGCGKRRAWTKVRKSGTHPIVYVALGSHAHYFRRGDIPFDLRPDCYPAVGAAVLRAALREVLDRTGDGVRLGSKQTRIVRITASSPAWMRYPGAWGEANLFHAGEQTFVYGLGPEGPAFHEIWRDPIGTPSRWRAG